MTEDDHLGFPATEVQVLVGCETFSAEKVVNEKENSWIVGSS